MHRPVFLAFAVAVMFTAGSARAQDSAGVPTVATAIELRNSGEFAKASEVLQQVLARESGNGDAARLHAQTLYWMKDIAGATAAYERAIAQHPEDTTLRLDFAQMLVETRSDVRARQILEPLLISSATRARAATLLGTSLYWEGDLTGAAKHFRIAIAADSNAADARLQLDEIRSIAAPWITIGASGLHDDQPLDRVGGNLEAGMFINPLLSVAARVRPMRFTPGGNGLRPTGDDPASTVIVGEAELAHSTPASRVETRLALGGVTHGGDVTRQDWTGRASARFRFPNYLSVEARGDRAPYLHTVASTAGIVMSNTGSFALGLASPEGWLGEAAVRAELFEDENSVRSAYAWILAPVIRATTLVGRIGYSFAAQDAEETRFNEAFQYAPYYTPENIVSHSALGSITIQASPTFTLNARGAYGFYAREDAPVFPVLPGIIAPYTLEFVRRSFRPWDAHISVNGALSKAATLSASIDRMKTAFYTATIGSIRLTYRFLPSASR